MASPRSPSSADSDIDVFECDKVVHQSSGEGDNMIISIVFNYATSNL